MADYSGLYVVMVLYFVALVGITGISFLQKRRAVADGGNQVAAHYGGSSVTFGPIVLILTTFSTLYSGYTVSGVPTEAARVGFSAVRWIVAVQVVVLSMLVIYPRLRRLAVTRPHKYTSPSDFIYDRFRSRPLQLLCTAFLCVPQIFYGTVQFVSFAGTFTGYIDGLSKLVAMIILAVITLGMEAIGGMKTVVFSDALQAGLMIVGFILVVIMLTAQYGGLATIIDTGCGSLGYINVNATEMLDATETPVECNGPWAALNATHNATCEAFGCVADARPSFLKYPSLSAQTSYFWFVANMLAFPLNPHMLQRGVQIASSDQAVKIMIMTLAVSPFLTMPPGIVMGVTHATFSKSWPAEIAEGAIFTSIGKMLMEQGAGAYFVVMLLTCSVLGAIMSTVDSVIIGVSNTVSVDVTNLVNKSDDFFTINVGRIVAFIMVVVCVVVGTQISPAQFGTLLTTQNGILLQIIPAYYLGLYTNVSTRSVSIGLCTGVAVFVIFEAIDAASNPFFPFVPAPNVAVIINGLVVLASHLIETLVPNIAPSPVEGALTCEAIEDVMKNSREPSRPLLVLAGLLCIFSCPLFMPFESSVPQPSIHGMPSYAYIVMVLQSICALCLLGAGHYWQPEMNITDSNEVKDDAECNQVIGNALPLEK